MKPSFNRRNKILWIPLAVLGGLGLLALGGWVVMWLWNHVLPGLVPGVGYLTFYKAVGLLLLCRILFGGFKGRHRGDFRGRQHWKEKMMHMSDEERQRFKEEWKQRCGR